MAEELITQFKVTYFNHPKAGKLAIMTMDNGEDYKKPNTFGAGAILSLNQAMDNLDKDIKGLMLTGKTFIFSVGANLMEIPGFKTKKEGVEVGRMGHAAFKRIMDLKVPTLAAINGAAMAGGVEIGLYCDYRSISTGAAPYSLTETFLGLVPGWGGTQLVTKLIGPEKAVELIIKNPLQNNRMINGKKAFEMGLADRLYEPVEFFDESVELLARLVTGKEKIKRKKPDMKNVKAVVDEAREFAKGRVHSGAIAPYRACDLIEGAATWSLDEGFEKESQTLGELIVSNQLLASVYSFDLTQRRAKQQVGIPKEAGALPVKKVGVIGAGLMASQLGFLLLQRLEVPLVMKDISQEVLDKCKDYIGAQLDRQAQKGKIDQAKADFLKTLVTYTLEDEGFAGCDFVLEAVFENMGVKQKVFAAAEKHVSDTAVLATNTSTLSITEMASKLKHPERVIGFHFFNPVSAMPLLEIIKGKKTNDVTTATAGAVAKKIRKTIVVLNDAPGFLVNRLLIRGNTVVVADIAAESNTTPQDIDEAFVDLGLMMGPFDLMALVGPAITLHTSEVMAAAFPDRYKVDPNIEKIVEMKKPGIYFPMTKELDPDVAKVLKRNESKPKLSKKEIQARFLEAMADEARRILDEGVVAEPQDIDTGLIFGAGYPFFMGGLTRYLDQQGISKKVNGKPFLTDKAFDAYLNR
jgi:3-hydroxyacyl-CoA dehydrogenase/enoyl-CoA hydratase/carnithine racemase